MNRSLTTLRPWLCLLTLVGLVLALTTVSALADSTKKAPKGKRETVSFIDPATVPKYNPDAKWQYEPCKHCNGRGYVLVTKFDRKKFNNVTRMRLCYYCRGKGTAGMSRK
jgi:DnaJ-class molecular chaperone